MQPHSQKEQNGEAVISFEVKRIFESCERRRNKQNIGLLANCYGDAERQAFIIIAYAQPNWVLLQQILPACYP